MFMFFVCVLVYLFCVCVFFFVLFILFLFCFCLGFIVRYRIVFSFFIDSILYDVLCIILLNSIQIYTICSYAKNTFKNHSHWRTFFYLEETVLASIIADTVPDNCPRTVAEVTFDKANSLTDLSHSFRIAYATFAPIVLLQTYQKPDQIKLVLHVRTHKHKHKHIHVAPYANPRGTAIIQLIQCPV